MTHYFTFYHKFLKFRIGFPILGLGLILQVNLYQTLSSCQGGNSGLSESLQNVRMTALLKSTGLKFYYPEGILESPVKHLRWSSFLHKREELMQLYFFAKALFCKIECDLIVPLNFCFLNLIKFFHKLFQIYLILKLVYANSRSGKIFVLNFYLRIQ